VATRVYLGLHAPSGRPTGEIVDREHATVSVLDRGFLYGDSVFEAFRTYRGVPLFLPEHLERLAASCAAVAMPFPPAREIADATLATIAAAEAADPAHGDSYVRVIVSRGEGEIGLDPALAEGSGPRLVVLVMTAKLPSRELYAEGAKLEIVGSRRSPRHAMDPKVKSSNYLNNVLALAEARKTGAYEAVMLDREGRILEGSTSNVFLARGGTLITPALEVGILEGITRRHVLELARVAGITVTEARPLPEDLETADEAFITSSIRGVLPMTRVGEHILSGGRPGPLTRRVMALYDELCAREAAEHPR
jgi:branched-chain amino acid aminotransferase